MLKKTWITSIKNVNRVIISAVLSVIVHIAWLKYNSQHLIGTFIVICCGNKNKCEINLMECDEKLTVEFCIVHTSYTGA